MTDALKQEEQEVDSAALDKALKEEGIDLNREEEEADFLSEFGIESEEKKEAEDEDEQEQEEPEVQEAKEKESKPDASQKTEGEKGSAATGDEKDRYIAQLEGRVRSIESKYGTLNSQLKYMSQVQRELKEAGHKAPTSQQIEEAKKSLEKFNELKQDFPSWGEAIEERMQALKQDLESKIPQAPKLDGFVSREQVSQLAKEQRDLAYIDLAFPEKDWETDLRSREFQLWFPHQAPEIKALADSDNKRDAVKLLKQFYEYMEPADPEPGKKKEVDKRLRGAVSPTRPGAARVKKENSEQDDFLEGFNS